MLIATLLNFNRNTRLFESWSRADPVTWASKVSLWETNRKKTTKTADEVSYNVEIEMTKYYFNFLLIRSQNQTPQRVSRLSDSPKNSPSKTRGAKDDWIKHNIAEETGQKPI